MYISAMYTHMYMYVAAYLRTKHLIYVHFILQLWPCEHAGNIHTYIHAYMHSHGRVNTHTYTHTCTKIHTYIHENILSRIDVINTLGER